MREVGRRKPMVPSTRPTSSNNTIDSPRHSGAQHGGTSVGELRRSVRGARGVADMGRRVSGPHAGAVTLDAVVGPVMGRGGEREHARAGPVARPRGVLGRVVLPEHHLCVESRSYVRDRVSVDEFLVSRIRARPWARRTTGTSFRAPSLLTASFQHAQPLLRRRCALYIARAYAVKWTDVRGPAGRERPRICLLYTSPSPRD